MCCRARLSSVLMQTNKRLLHYRYSELTKPAESAPEPFLTSEDMRMLSSGIGFKPRSLLCLPSVPPSASTARSRSLSCWSSCKKRACQALSCRTVAAYHLQRCMMTNHPQICYKCVP